MRKFIILNCIFVFCVYFSSYVNANDLCGEPGCYISQAFPCSFTSECLFQYDETVFNCRDVPLGSTIDVSCQSINLRPFSMSIIDHGGYMEFIDGDYDYATLNPSSQSDFFTVDQKDFSFTTTKTMQNYHLVVEIEDHSICVDVLCTFNAY